MIYSLTMGLNNRFLIALFTTLSSLLVVLLINSSFAGCNNANVQVKDDVPGYMSFNHQAINDLHASFSLKEKAGLLFMYSRDAGKLAGETALQEKIVDHHIGGVCFTRGASDDLKAVTRNLKNMRKLPFIFGINGVKEKFININELQPLTEDGKLGSVTDSKVYTTLASSYGQIMQEHNLNMLLRPSFYPNQHLAGKLSDAVGNTMLYNLMKFWRRWETQHMIATVDVHYGNDEGAPAGFKLSKNQTASLVKSGLGGVMENPAIQHGPHEISFVQWLDSVEYKGVVFNSRMLDQSRDVHPGNLAEDLRIGYEVFLGGDSIFSMHKQLVEMAREDSTLRQLIDRKSKKVLGMIKWSNPSLKKHQEPGFSMKKQLGILREVLAEHAMVAIENKNDFIPVRQLERTSMASVAIANGAEQHFQEVLGRYHQVKNFTVTHNASKETFLMLLNHIKRFDRVVLSVHPEVNGNGHLKQLNTKVLDFIERLGYTSKVILTVFAQPGYLSQLNDFSHPQGIIATWGNDSLIQNKAAQLIFGGIMPSGQLAQNVDMRLKAGAGKVISREPCRLGYASPGMVGINADTLQHIRRLMTKAINDKALPGGQIIAARRGRVFYREHFGSHTYSKKTPVGHNHLYDLASLTKPAATTLALMKQFDQEKFELQDRLSRFIPALDTTNKDKLEFKDVLGHQARLASWLPFYYKTYENFRKRELRKDIYRNHMEPQFTSHVAKDLYAWNSFRDSILKIIYASSLKPFKRYKYSDLGFYLLHKAFDGMEDKPLDQYLDSVYYAPLGANTLSFNPLRKFEASRIAPTENDTYFRKQLLQGYVQDRGAALLGGVSGHAGLFGNAGDMAKVMQMLLNKGTYGCEQYLKASTVELFTSNPFVSRRNHRGLGFDKPDPDKGNGLACKGASVYSFGHLGFTGTMVWADPKYDLLYVFLSNRVYPSIENNKIVQMDLRQQVQQVLYNAIVPGDYDTSSLLQQRIYDERKKQMR